MIPRPLAFAGMMIATAIVYMIASLWAGLHQVREAIVSCGASAVTIGLALTVGNVALRYFRWDGYLTAMNYAIPSWRSFRVYVAGFALATTPGGAGEPVVRGMFLKPLGVSYPKTVAAYLTERMSDVIVMLGLTTLGLTAYAPARPYVAAIGAALVGFLLLLGSPVWMDATISRLQHRAGRVVHLVLHVLQTASHMRRLSAPGALLIGLFIGLAAWLLQCVAFYVIVDALGARLSFQIAVFVYALSALIGALSFLPGGLGTTEISMVGLLVLFGVSDAHAVAATILLRLITLWFTVALGAWCYVGLLRQGDASTHQC